MSIEINLVANETNEADGGGGDGGVTTVELVIGGIRSARSGVAKFNRIPVVVIGTHRHNISIFGRALTARVET